MSEPQPGDTLPADAITAAAKALRDDGWSDDTLGTINRVARVALEAAAPALRAQGAAAAKFIIVWRDERGDEICSSTPLGAGATRIGIPLDAFCADLLDGGTSSAASGDGTGKTRCAFCGGVAPGHALACPHYAGTITRPHIEDGGTDG